MYLAVADALGVPPTSCVAVEDSANGIRAASSAGMAVVAVPNREFPPGPEALSLAACRIGALDELTPALIERVGAGA